MTHTLHRMGTVEELAHDFVVLAHAAKGINVDTAPPKYRRFLELAAKQDPVNMGGAHRNLLVLGSPVEVRNGVITGRGSVHAVFSNAEALTRFLHDLVIEQLGLSVVVSGRFDLVVECCRRVGLAPHTVEYSAGILGKTATLPDAGVLRITTMCGHAMISPALVQHFSQAAALGRVTPRQAAIEMGKLCLCGVFNPDHAEELIAALAASKGSTADAGAR